jgi:hypothetical protein
MEDPQRLIRYAIASPKDIEAAMGTLEQNNGTLIEPGVAAESK